MTDSGELTYWEYWLTKDVWDARMAIQLIVDFNKFKRAWHCGDNNWKVNEILHDDIENKINGEKATYLFTKWNTTEARYDKESGLWEEAKIVIDQSDLHPRKFIEWLYAKGYSIPYEFKVFIGIEESVEVINQKMQEKIDKEVCQGIARTLWDIYPKMEIEAMVDEKAIQIYGSGRLHSRDTTLRRWLSEVDPREVKRGPKKK